MPFFGTTRSPGLVWNVLFIPFYVQYEANQPSYLTVGNMNWQTAPNCTALNCITLLYTALYWTAHHWTALRCTGVDWIVFYCTALHFTLNCIAAQCTAVHCTALSYTALQLMLGPIPGPSMPSMPNLRSPSLTTLRFAIDPCHRSSKMGWGSQNLPKL